ncbi:hypothetical protein C2E23DRAFT_871531 [Lenzites betulinus]|nr:hypothetical protein C2E23DRAFT_871531 [Lenzites betulinus]
MAPPLDDAEYWAAFEDSDDDEPLNYDDELGYTASARETFCKQGGNLEASVVKILELIKDEGLNLEIFLDAIFWGDSGCQANYTISHQRAVFMRSPTLVTVLDNWWHPPTRKDSGGGKPMEDFVLARAGELLEEDMDNVMTRFRPPQDMLSKERLTSVNFRLVGNELRTTHTPRLWSLLEQLACTRRQQKLNKHKNPFHVVLTIISMLSYSRSHDSCLLTVIWSIYLKACGLSARSFDALHALGFTMSHKWAANTFAKISMQESATTRQLIQARAHFGSHDNLNFPERVFSQRGHNMSRFISASAATIYILPKGAGLPPDIAQKVKEHRRQAFSEPFPLQALYEVDAANVRIKAHARYQILQFLLNSPAFTNYTHRNSNLLTSPPPTLLLQSGPDHIAEQWILETVEVDESSYDGTDKLCNDIWLTQMGLGSEDAKRRLGEESLLVWVGDQLTVDRIRGLTRYRYADPNSFSRMEWLEPVFGWFHALMAFANSLHTQYLGTSVGIGLRRAFETLGRKGLVKTETKGVFWHHLNEALWHVGEGNFLQLWATAGNVDHAADLVTCTPEELLAILDKLYEEHIVQRAQEDMDDLPEHKHDEVAWQMAMFSADLLGYFNLCEAMRLGDVGRMEDLLPTMLFRFAGGGNHKYAVEVLELLHKLRSEWPEELRTYIRTYCWLVNFSGKHDGFLAVDMAQEHNIKDIKVTWRSFGPGATLSYIQKVSPAIPVLRAVKANIASQFSSIQGRGTRHGTPEKAADIERMVAMFCGFQAHTVEEGRNIKGGESDHATDYVTLGATKLQVEGMVERWWSDRLFERATTEVWALPDRMDECTT